MVLLSVSVIEANKLYMPYVNNCIDAEQKRVYCFDVLE